MALPGGLGAAVPPNNFTILPSAPQFLCNVGTFIKSMTFFLVFSVNAMIGFVCSNSLTPLTVGTLARTNRHS